MGGLAARVDQNTRAATVGFTRQWYMHVAIPNLCSMRCNISGDPAFREKS